MKAPGAAWVDLTLRQAVAADALCLSVLAMQVFLDTYATEGIRPALAREVLREYAQEKFLAAMADSKCQLTLAESAGHLIGFAHTVSGATQALAPAGAQAELLRLYVQEPFTGAKVGTRLLRHAEQQAHAAGATVLWLTTWVHNHRALAFYASRGYTDYGLTQFVFEGEAHANRVFAKGMSAC